MLLKVLLKTLNTNVILYVSQNISILIPEISDILEDKGFRQPMEDLGENCSSHIKPKKC
jgi:hypothetical protein